MGNISPNLSVKNVKKTLDFYVQKLGFTQGMTFPNPDKPEYADASKDGMVFMFTPAAESVKDKAGAGVNFYLQIDGDIDDLYKELKKRGIKMILEIKDEPFGIRDFSIEDPDGYRLTFNAPIKASAEGATGAKCQSCGMPMASLSETGSGKPNLYCVHCCHQDGSLKTYEEVLDGMINFMMTSQRMERAAAGKAAREYLSMMPAWCEK